MCRILEGELNRTQKAVANNFSKIIITEIDNSKFMIKKYWLPNYLINLLLFINKSLVLLIILWINFPYKKWIVDNIEKFCSNLKLSKLRRETNFFRFFCDRHSHGTVNRVRILTHAKMDGKITLQVWVKCVCGIFPFVYSLFVMPILIYYLDKCGVLNEIVEPAIYIFKINTILISNTRLYRIST